MNKIIKLIVYVIIGLVQGFTEILPISSSGHLLLTYSFLNVSTNDQLNLTISLHFASCLALMIYFFKDIKAILKGSVNYVLYKKNNNKNDFLLLLYILISSIPAAITALLLKDYIDLLFDDIKYLYFFFLITSLLLYIYDLIKVNNKSYNFKNTFIIGLTQCICLFPGISRSGTTIFVSKLLKIEKTKGKTFSFLLLIPISFGSFFISIIDVIKNNTLTCEDIFYYFIAMIVAFFSTLLSLKIIFNKTDKIKFKCYSFYLIMLSIIILFFYL